MSWVTDYYKNAEGQIASPNIRTTLCSSSAAWNSSLLVAPVHDVQ